MAKSVDKQKSSLSFKIMTIVGIVLLVVLIPCLICNVTLITKSLVKPEEVPDFMGYKPFIVLSGSMQPTIMLDDLVLTKEISLEEIDKLEGIGKENWRIKRVPKLDAEGNTIKENGFTVFETEVVDGKVVPKAALDDNGKTILDLDSNNNPQPEYVFDENGQVKRGEDKYPMYKYGDSDVIAYHTATADEIEKSGEVGTVVTHRIITKGETEEGVKYFVVRGDNNNVSDTIYVTYDMVEGVYLGTRLAKIGALAIFLQKPVGLVIFIGVPLLLFVLWDVIRRRMYEKKERAKLAEIEAAEEAERLEREAKEQAERAAKEAEMLAEIERLKAAAAGASAPVEETPVEETPAE